MLLIFKNILPTEFYWNDFIPLAYATECDESFKKNEIIIF